MVIRHISMLVGEINRSDTTSLNMGQLHLYVNLKSSKLIFIYLFLYLFFLNNIFYKCTKRSYFRYDGMEIIFYYLLYEYFAIGTISPQILNK